MNARRIDSLAAATSPGSSSGSTRPSGIGSIHVASPRALSVARSATCRLTEVHRASATLLAAQHVEADVRCDAIQPGPQRGAALERVVGLPRPDHRLLHGVLGLEPRAEHAVAVGDQLAAVLLELAIQRQRRRVGGGGGDIGHAATVGRDAAPACRARGVMFHESRGRGRWTVDEAFGNASRSASRHQRDGLITVRAVASVRMVSLMSASPTPQRPDEVRADDGEDHATVLLPRDRRSAVGRTGLAARVPRRPGTEPITDDALLVLSELATNALRHGLGEVAVRAAIEDGGPCSCRSPTPGDELPALQPIDPTRGRRGRVAHRRRAQRRRGASPRSPAARRCGRRCPVVADARSGLPRRGERRHAARVDGGQHVQVVVHDDVDLAARARARR